MVPIVMIHGWSDSSASLTKLATRLRKETGRAIDEMWLGDYVSLDDEVTMADIAIAMQRAWDDSGLPAGPNSVDVVIHSTGGLVLRDWMSRFWPNGAKPPVRNLVMLAPANCGSPLAHKGRSVIGRVVKGWKSEDTFETGTHVLKALEMAGPYTWALAEDDRFAANAFSHGGVRCTVIVGNHGYTGISSLANEDGSDGTVYVSTANLNMARIDVTVSRDSGELSAGAVELSRGKTAFLILDGFDHSSITGREKLPRRLLDPILTALGMTKTGFARWCRDCEQASSEVRARYAKTRDPEYHAFQNTVFRVRDDTGAPVTDYVVEFYGEFTESSDRWATLFKKRIARKIHVNGEDKSRRSFMIDTTAMNQLIDRIDESLKFSLSATPDVTTEGALVGYKSFGDEDIGAFELKQPELARYFAPDRTLFVTIVIPRVQRPKVFGLKTLERVSAK